MPADPCDGQSVVACRRRPVESMLPVQDPGYRMLYKLAGRCGGLLSSDVFPARLGLSSELEQDIQYCSIRSAAKILKRHVVHSEPASTRTPLHLYPGAQCPVVASQEAPFCTLEATSAWRLGCFPGPYTTVLTALRQRLLSCMMADGVRLPVRPGPGWSRASSSCHQASLRR